MAPSVTSSQTIVIDTDFNDNPILNTFGVAKVTDINAATTNLLGLPTLGGKDEDTITGAYFPDLLGRRVFEKIRLRLWVSWSMSFHIESTRVLVSSSPLV
ncbi:MAG: hypothetical protein CMO60_06730, partial [Verrucomicrobiales bacterium]|nr:hypothetical protein [Verrucomicrobiales bacterium]